MSLVASQAQALTGLARPPVADPALGPQSGVATPEDMEKAQIEKSYYHWRRRRWLWGPGWRRRRRRYWRRRYW